MKFCHGACALRQTCAHPPYRFILHSMPPDSDLAHDGPPIADPALARFLREELGVDEATVATPSPHQWRFTGPVWVWRGSGTGAPPKAAWYFLTIDGDVAATIRASTRGTTGGFGSIRVTATIGATRWQTSLFPAKASGGYLLPLKAGVRKAEGLTEGIVTTVTLTPE